MVSTTGRSPVLVRIPTTNINFPSNRRCVRRNQDECRRYLDQFKVFDHPLKQSSITVSVS